MHFYEFDEEFRLLLEICNMLLRILRTSVPVSEMIASGKHFQVDGEELVSNLIKYGLFEQKGDTLFLLKTKEEVAEMIKECSYEKESSFKIIPGALAYRLFEVRKELILNKYDYLGLKIRNKTISGIGNHAIVLKESEDDEPEFHNWLPETRFLVGSGNNHQDGCKLAIEIIKEHGDIENNPHLKYITTPYDE